MYGLINGKIYTVNGADWDKKPVSAMAVSDDGKILAVGTAEEIKAVLADDAEIYDLKGQTVVPGFIDAHTHIPGTSLTELYLIDLYGAFDKEETLKRVRDFIEAHPENDKYFGLGFNMGILQKDPSDMPVKWLDEICSDKPISMKSYDGHTQWLNSCAMEKLGITKDTVTHGAGLIQKNDAGELKGVFTDVRDIGLEDPVFNDEQQVAALKHYIKKMNAWGYTSLNSMAPTFGVSFDKYLDVEKDGELTMRATIASTVYSDKAEEEFEILLKMRDEIKSDKLKVQTAKFFLDGVVEGNTAWLKKPYDPAAGLGDNYNVPPEWDTEELKKYFRKAAEAGFGIHCHAIGDAAICQALDCFESIKDIDVDCRGAITHLQVVDEPDLDRFAELDVIAAIQTYWHLKEPDFYEEIDLASLGAERAAKEYPAKSFVNRGVRITASGDFPVSFMNNPFMGIRAGVTRNLYSLAYYGEEINDIDDPRFLLNPAERLSVKDMIEAYTINGAYQIYREDEVGSLEAGKFADYLILDADPLTIDPLKLDGIKVLHTVFEGKKVEL